MRQWAYSTTQEYCTGFLESPKKVTFSDKLNSIQNTLFGGDAYALCPNMVKSKLLTGMV